MTYQPFLVADLREGLVRDIEPWILPTQAYPNMTNMFTYDGIVQKKGGNKLLGRLGSRSETLATRGAADTIINLTLTWQPIEAGSIIITDGTTIFTDDGVGGFTITGGTGTVNTATDYTTGAIDITFTTANAGVDITTLYYMLVNDYSMAMGLWNIETDESTDSNLIGFDRLKSYLYNDSEARFRDVAQYKTSDYEINWSGDDADFFWCYNYRNALWTTNNVSGGHFYAITGITSAASAVITIGTHNFVNGDRIYIANVTGMTEINNQLGTVTATAATTITVNINSGAYGAYTAGGIVWSIEKSKASSGDGIRWYDNGHGWVNFAPPTDSSTTPNLIQGCLQMVPYKGRLLCFNTVEGTTYAGNKRHSQRVRYSQNGIPFTSMSFPTDSGITTSAGDAWYQTAGKGGYIDAATEEEIVSVGFIKDTLIVFFEKSTWKLDYTSNPVLPFIWNRINSELGSESTFSTVNFDKSVTTVGGLSIASCDSANMIRIDDKIPEQVYNFHNEFDGESRVHGIRDYYNNSVLWTYSDSSTNSTYPNRELVYNHKDLCWAKLINYYTVYGYYRRGSDLTWGAATKPWAAYDIAWRQEAMQSKFPFVVGGNTHGFVHEVQDVDHSDLSGTNDTYYVIQDISGATPAVLTVPNHGLRTGDTVLISGVNGLTTINGNIYSIVWIDADTFSLSDENGDGFVEAGYTYGGYITIIDNFNLETKKFNPFFEIGQKVKIGYIDLLLQNTVSGSINVKLYFDENDAQPAISQTVDLVDPKSLVTNKFWYRLYLNTTAQTCALKFSYTDTANGQIYDLVNNEQDVKLHGWILWASPAGRLV